MLRYYLDPTARPYPSLVPPLPDILNTVYVASKHRWNSGSGGLLRFLRIYKLELAKIFAFATLWILGVFAAPLSMNLVRRLASIFPASAATHPVYAAPPLRPRSHLYDCLSLPLRRRDLSLPAPRIRRVPKCAVPSRAIGLATASFAGASGLCEAVANEGGRRRIEGRSWDWRRRRGCGQGQQCVFLPAFGTSC